MRTDSPPRRVVSAATKIFKRSVLLAAVLAVPLPHERGRHRHRGLARHDSSTPLAGELSENEMTEAGLKLKKLNRLVLGCIEAKVCK